MSEQRHQHQNQTSSSQQSQKSQNRRPSTPVAASPMFGHDNKDDGKKTKSNSQSSNVSRSSSSVGRSRPSSPSSQTSRVSSSRPSKPSKSSSSSQQSQNSTALIQQKTNTVPFSAFFGDQNIIGHTPTSNNNNNNNNNNPNIDDDEPYDDSSSHQDEQERQQQQRKRPATVVVAPYGLRILQQTGRGQAPPPPTIEDDDEDDVDDTIDDEDDEQEDISNVSENNNHQPIITTSGSGHRTSQISSSSKQNIPIPRQTKQTNNKDKKDGDDDSVSSSHDSVNKKNETGDDDDENDDDDDDDNSSITSSSSSSSSASSSSSRSSSSSMNSSDTMQRKRQEEEQQQRQRMLQNQELAPFELNEDPLLFNRRVQDNLMRALDIGSKPGFLPSRLKKLVDRGLAIHKCLLPFYANMERLDPLSQDQTLKLYCLMCCKWVAVEKLYKPSEIRRYLEILLGFIAEDTNYGAQQATLYAYAVNMEIRMSMYITSRMAEHQLLFTDKERDRTTNAILRDCINQVLEQYPSDEVEREKIERNRFMSNIRVMLLKIRTQIVHTHVSINTCCRLASEVYSSNVAFTDMIFDPQALYNDQLNTHDYLLVAKQQIYGNLYMRGNRLDDGQLVQEQLVTYRRPGSNKTYTTGSRMWKDVGKLETVVHGIAFPILASRTLNTNTVVLPIIQELTNNPHNYIVPHLENSAFTVSLGNGVFFTDTRTFVPWHELVNQDYGLGARCAFPEGIFNPEWNHDFTADEIAHFMRNDPVHGEHPITKILGDQGYLWDDFELDHYLNQPEPPSSTSRFYKEFQAYQKTGGERARLSTMHWIMALLGRNILPAFFQGDDMQVMIWLIGYGGTGKTLISEMVRRFHRKILTITDGNNRGFGWSRLGEVTLVHISEIGDSDVAMGPFNSTVSGEASTVDVKHKDAVEVNPKCTVIASTNNLIANDKNMGEANSRRCVFVDMACAVFDSDPTLKARAAKDQEMIRFMVACLQCLRLVREYMGNSQGFWKSTHPMFRVIRNTFSESRNSLLAFFCDPEVIQLMPASEALRAPPASNAPSMKTMKTLNRLDGHHDATRRAIQMDRIRNQFYALAEEVHEVYKVWLSRRKDDNKNKRTPWEKLTLQSTLAQLGLQSADTEMFFPPPVAGEAVGETSQIMRQGKYIFGMRLTKKAVDVLPNRKKRNNVSVPPPPPPPPVAPTPATTAQEEELANLPSRAHVASDNNINKNEMLLKMDSGAGIGHLKSKLPPPPPPPLHSLPQSRHSSSSSHKNKRHTAEERMTEDGNDSNSNGHDDDDDDDDDNGDHSSLELLDDVGDHTALTRGFKVSRKAVKKALSKKEVQEDNINIRKRNLKRAFEPEPPFAPSMSLSIGDDDDDDDDDQKEVIEEDDVVLKKRKKTGLSTTTTTTTSSSSRIHPVSKESIRVESTVGHPISDRMGGSRSGAGQEKSSKRKKQYASEGEEEENEEEEEERPKKRQRQETSKQKMSFVEEMAEASDDDDDDEEEEEENEYEDEEMEEMEEEEENSD